MSPDQIRSQLEFFESIILKDDAERFLSGPERKRAEADVADHREWLAEVTAGD